MNGGTALDTFRSAPGEESLGHSGWQQFFWFDINAHRLYTRENNEAWNWQFDEYVSAAGWVDAEQLIIALETVSFLFDLRKGAQGQRCAVEAADPANPQQRLLRRCAERVLDWPHGRRQRARIGGDLA